MLTLLRPAYRTQLLRSCSYLRPHVQPLSIKIAHSSLGQISKPAASLSSRQLHTSHLLSDANAVPDLDGIIMTPACAKKLKQLQTVPQYTGHDIHLRVEVVPGGCSGFEYKFSVEKEDEAPPQEDDIVLTQHGARLVVDTTSESFLRGATIDYVTEMIRSAFSVTSNPNSDTSCGCGTSFSPKNF